MMETNKKHTENALKQVPPKEAARQIAVQF